MRSLFRLAKSTAVLGVLATIDKEGVDPATMTAAEFTAFVHSDIDRWRGVARKLDIVAE